MKLALISLIIGLGLNSQRPFINIYIHPLDTKYKGIQSLSYAEFFSKS